MANGKKSSAAGSQPQKDNSTWSDILNGIKSAAVDLSSLEVVTLTGDMRTVIENGSVKDLSTLQQNINKGEIQVVATTRIDFDADTTNFVAREDFEGKDALLELHEKSKSAALESRQAALDFVFNMVKNLM